MSWQEHDSRKERFFSFRTSMLGSDTKTGNSSQATQAVVTGSHHRLSPTSLRYLQWTHQPRLSGSLTSIGTLKKDMTCPGNIPTSSRTFFPAYSTTMNILCLLTSRLWTPAVIPRVPVCGVPGCRAQGRRGWSTFLCRLALTLLASPSSPTLSPGPHAV